MFQYHSPTAVDSCSFYSTVLFSNLIYLLDREFRKFRLHLFGGVIPSFL